MKQGKNTTTKKKRIGPRVSTLGLILLFLLGAGIAAYPTISDFVARYNSIEAIEEYRAYTTNLSDEELKAEWQKARIYNDNLAGDPVRDPFVPESGMALPENYQDVLNVAGDGVMGYLEIPKINVALLIFHGTGDKVLKTAAGHIEQTSLPIGGANSHPVLTAHTGLPSARLFTDLTELEEGDRFYIYVLDQKLTYEVDQIEVILPEEVDKLHMVPGEDYVTLLTCTPYGVNSHRLLVRGVRVPNEDEEVAKVEKPDILVYILPIVLVVILLVILFLIIRFVVNKRRRDRDSA
ncbi:MAG TPA: class C sortase [Candidatus Pelethocola excrementipullorum]|nr:class C sortase [Candidatus Pelethocola excrementipullorum]